MQICVGSGVPGKGAAAVHLAHAQSVDGTVFSPETTPSIVSAVRVTSVALVVSSDCGLYGTGFEWTIIGCDAGPAVGLLIRPITLPVIGVPSALTAIGTTT